MEKAQRPRVQALAAQALFRPLVAVDQVAEQRVTDVRHVHADLVRAAGLKLAADVRVAVVACDDRPVRDGAAGVFLCHGHALAIRGVAADGRVHRAGIVAQLSSMVAHELRQPLMSIMNFVGGLSLYMRKTYPADPVVAQTADVIVEEAERASAIVDRVRGYDKTAHAQKIPIAAKDLIASAVRAFSHSALSSGVTVRTDCRTNACVLGDPLELTLVILNFLKNAADAMADVSEKVIHLSAQQSGGNIVFRVRDYGPPLTNEVFETLSHPTVSHKPHGLGLGLSLAKSIAERHRGHIDFVRAQPNGLIAVLELPCLLNTSPSEAGTTVLQDSGQRKTHHE